MFLIIFTHKENDDYPKINSSNSFDKWFIILNLLLLLILFLYTVKNGTVKFFNESKGFGFITEEGSSEEYFVHVSGLIDRIEEGDTVEFELKEGKKGLNAINVKVI